MIIILLIFRTSLKALSAPSNLLVNETIPFSTQSISIEICKYNYFRFGISCLVAEKTKEKKRNGK